MVPILVHSDSFCYTYEEFTVFKLMKFMTVCVLLSLPVRKYVKYFLSNVYLRHVEVLEPLYVFSVSCNPLTKLCQHL